MPPEPSAIPHAVLSVAADWLLRLHAAPGDSAEHSACQRWCEQHPDHARAWQRAQQLQRLLQQVPPALALPVLGRAPDAQRRAAVKRIGLWMALMPVGWLGWELLAPARNGLEQRTAVGERRRVMLPDGSALLLDTDTRVIVRFDAHQRDLQLQHGRIRIETAPDPQAPPRPLQVTTAQGRIRALGTRFDVRVDGRRTALALLEGRLEITPVAGAPWYLAAGQQAWFDMTGTHVSQALDGTASAWSSGMLVADALPLGVLLAELGRYRHGLLRCDPEVAQLPVSGAFPLDDTARSLALLEATYPIRVQVSAGGRWVTVVAR